MKCAVRAASYEQVAGNTTTAVMAFLQTLYVRMNQIYIVQLGVLVTIDQTIIMAGPGTYPWNWDRTTAACPGITDALVVFSDWRANTHPTDHGLVTARVFAIVCSE